jgi:tellurite methyltransferase
MSELDREKWQQRYREGAYRHRNHASSFLTQNLPQIREAQQDRTALRALDIACGAGRNSLFLASQGYQVDAIDISPEALHRGESAAHQSGIQGLRWIEHDLDKGLPDACDSYDLIIMVRYLHLPLLQSACARLNPGGFLLSEVHLRSDIEVAGPEGSRFRAEAGALRNAAHDLLIATYKEGLEEDPDGRTVALARLLARRDP